MISDGGGSFSEELARRVSQQAAVLGQLAVARPFTRAGSGMLSCVFASLLAYRMEGMFPHVSVAPSNTPARMIYSFRIKLRYVRRDTSHSVSIAFTHDEFRIDGSACPRCPLVHHNERLVFPFNWISGAEKINNQEPFKGGQPPFNLDSTLVLSLNPIPK